MEEIPEDTLDEQKAYLQRILDRTKHYVPENRLVGEITSLLLSKNIEPSDLKPAILHLAHDGSIEQLYSFVEEVEGWGWSFGKHSQQELKKLLKL